MSSSCGKSATFRPAASERVAFFLVHAVLRNYALHPVGVIIWLFGASCHEQSHWQTFHPHHCLARSARSRGAGRGPSTPPSSLRSVGNPCVVVVWCLCCVHIYVCTYYAIGAFSHHGPLPRLPAPTGYTYFLDYYKYDKAQRKESDEGEPSVTTQMRRTFCTTQ